MATHRGAADQRRHAHDGSRAATQRISYSGHSQDDADGHDGVARGQQDDVGLPDGVKYSGRGNGAVHPYRNEFLCSNGGIHAHPPLLEMDSTLGILSLAADDDVGLDGRIRHR